MIDIIIISVLVLMVVSLGGWYAVRTFRLVKADDELPPDVLNNLKAAAGKSVMPEFKIAPEALAGFTEAFQKLGAAARSAIPAMAEIGNSVERVLESKSWKVSKPYLDWHDLWLGCYWKVTENNDIDTDILDIYICLLPCVVIHVLRVRCWQLVPKIDNRIDPVCLTCGLPHSEHPVVPDIGVPVFDAQKCYGKFLI